jgi:hypothetical protein
MRANAINLIIMGYFFARDVLLLLFVLGSLLGDAFLYAVDIIARIRARRRDRVARERAPERYSSALGADGIIHGGGRAFTRV